MTIHKEGYKLITLAFILCTTVSALGGWLFGTSSLWFYLVLAVCIVFFYLVVQFFRLPNRVNKAAANELVAPCDGKVVVIEEVEEPEYFKGKRLQVSIFMSPLNVHANWVTCEGKIKYAKYHEGLYLVAWHPKSSTENERTTVVIEHPNGKEVLLRQIAGAVARRIVYYVKPGDQVKRNDQFGFIKFGSRVDIFLPVGTEVVAKLGDVTKGNETVIARW
ncbi:MAG: phosphatidylserine decarboxylase family protein [Flavobacteriales bacterium]|nr:phosphatidylserine decarboxylase family protein [Flavobacteriales bacterium]